VLVEPDVFPDPVLLGRRAARLIADGIIEARAARRPFLLGCPSGRSPRTTYQSLAELVRVEDLDLSHVVVVLMDDYLVRSPDGQLVHEDARAAHSCIRFGREEIVRPLTAAAGPGHGVAEDNLWVPDPADPGGYDRRIADAGGIDVFLLASGAGDGHVAFNAPGSPADSVTRVVELPDSTRRDNLATFESFGGRLERVPTHGVTVGIDTIRSRSASTIMLIHGRDKGRAAQRLLGALDYDPSWPATVLAACRRPRLFLDQAAVTAAASVL
jgi:glucosamine-6-phosphate deaminase